MAELSLAGFFALHHGCSSWTLQKAVMRCAAGPRREDLREKAYSWDPGTYFHRTLKRIMIAAGDDQFTQAAPMPEPLTQNQITPAVTRVRKKLEMLCLEPLTPLPPPPKAETLWDIFNATDRYSQDDIRGAIWLILNDGTWGPVLQAQTRAHWHDTRNAWECRLISLISAQPRPPPVKTLRMYSIAGRTVAWMRREQSRKPAPPPLPRPPVPETLRQMICSSGYVPADVKAALQCVLMSTCGITLLDSAGNRWRPDNFRETEIREFVLGQPGIIADFVSEDPDVYRPPARKMESWIRARANRGKPW